MVKRIEIHTSSAGILNATLTDENPITVEALWTSIPLEGKANLWGDEIYFSTTIKAPAENTKEVVEMGNIAYWPPGNALCLFFGLTPVSRAGEIRPASPVNVIGRVEKDFKKLKSVKQGEKIVQKTKACGRNI